MCNVVSVVNRVSAPTPESVCYTEANLRKALSRQKGVRRYAFAPVDDGKYTQAEYDTFVRNHAVKTAKKKKPDWNVGDKKPFIWQLVVEYEPEDCSGKAWEWIGASKAGSHEYKSGDFDSYVKKLRSKKRNNNQFYSWSIEDAPEAGTQEMPAAKEPASTSAVDIPEPPVQEREPFDPFLEAATGIVSDIMGKTPDDFRAALIALAKENLRVSEENNILRSRLAGITAEIGRTMETVAELSAC